MINAASSLPLSSGIASSAMPGPMTMLLPGRASFELPKPAPVTPDEVAPTAAPDAGEAVAGVPTIDISAQFEPFSASIPRCAVAPTEPVEVTVSENLAKPAVDEPVLRRCMFDPMSGKLVAEQPLPDMVELTDAQDGETEDDAGTALATAPTPDAPAPAPEQIPVAIVVPVIVDAARTVQVQRPIMDTRPARVGNEKSEKPASADRALVAIAVTAKEAKPHVAAQLTDIGNEIADANQPIDIPALIAPTTDDVAVANQFTTILNEVGIVAAHPGVSQADAVAMRHLDLARDTMWLDQLSRDIVAASDSTGKISFRMNPERLGQLDVALTKHENGVSVRLATSSDEASKIIAAAQPALVENLEVRGIRVVETQIGNNGAFSQQQERNPHHGVAHLIETASLTPQGQDDDGEQSTDGRFA